MPAIPRLFIPRRYTGILSGASSGGGGGGGNVPAFIATTSWSTGGSSSQATDAMNSTGANAIFAFVSYYPPGGSVSSVTDNYGNTYSSLTAGASGNLGGQWWYALNATVGAGHIVTANASFPTIFACAFSNILTSGALDGQNIGNDGTTTSTGSITPTANGDLILAAIATNLTSQTFSADSGMTIVQTNNYNCAAYYKIQATAAPINVTFSWDGSIANSAAGIAAFKHN